MQFFMSWPLGCHSFQMSDSRKLADLEGFTGPWPTAVGLTLDTRWSVRRLSLMGVLGDTVSGNSNPHRDFWDTPLNLSRAGKQAPILIVEMHPFLQKRILPVWGSFQQLLNEPIFFSLFKFFLTRFKGLRKEAVTTAPLVMPRRL